MPADQPCMLRPGNVQIFVHPEISVYKSSDPATKKDVKQLMAETKEVIQSKLPSN